jgi:hypothetical protein
LKQLKNTSFSAELDQPVFIMGIPRSGTTLLYSCMLSHPSLRPDLARNSKGFLAESKAFIRPNNVFDSEQADKYLIYNQSVKNKFLASVSKIRFYQTIGNLPYRFLGRRTTNSEYRKMAFKLGLNHVVLQQYFQYAKAARRVNRIVEKTPGHIEKIPEIRATFPNAKCIFLYRHPIDVFSSYRKRLKIAESNTDEKESLAWLRITIKDFIRNYRSRVQIAFHEVNSSNRKNFMMLKYESMTHYPRDTFEEICDFLDEPFEEQIIPRGESQQDSRYSGFLGGEIVNKTKDWEDFIDRKNAQLIEDRLSDIMEKLRYHRYT